MLRSLGEPSGRIALRYGMADVLGGVLGLTIGIVAFIFGGGQLFDVVFGGQPALDVLLVNGAILAVLYAFAVIGLGRLLCLAWVYRWGETSRTEALLYLTFGLVPSGWRSSKVHS